jgi:carboxyl-terminal processing protease
MNEHKNLDKKTIIIIIVAIVLITNFITFTLITTFGVSFGGRSVIAVDSSYTAQKINKLIYLYNELNDKYIETLDKDALWESAYKGLFEGAGDEYTLYMDKETYDEYKQDVTGKYAGIGVRIVQGDDNLVTVITVFKDSPAEKAGMQVGDKIIVIDDKDATQITADQAASYMRGEAGTTVEVTVERNEKQISMTITRAAINVESVSGSILNGNIGYICISEFSSDVSDQFASTLDEQLNKGITSLIIDLRNNPGGDVNETLAIADRILSSALIIYTQDRTGKKEEYNSSASQSLNIPIVVLINEYSASASEILAAALKDNNAAVLIGTKSYGKGVIQSMQSMSDGSGYKITIEQYFSPNGNTINKVGIEPDIAVSLPDNVTYKYGKITQGQDTQLAAAINYLKNK